LQNYTLFSLYRVEGKKLFSENGSLHNCSLTI